MTGRNKNKRGNQHVYVDRNVVLRESNKLPNIAFGIHAIPCVGKEKTGSLERHFKHKLSDSDKDSPMLTAMVLNNDICVLVIESDIQAIVSASFSVEADSDSISGKKKKGAKKIKANSPILTLNFTDGSTREYLTPVGGQLLETNLNLLLQPNLLLEQPCGAGFVAVIYPDTEIPSLTNGLSGKLISDLDKKSNICFSFVKGLCRRGDSCKFSHDADLDQVCKKAKITDDRTTPDVVTEDSSSLLCTDTEAIPISASTVTDTDD